MSGIESKINSHTPESGFESWVKKSEFCMFRGIGFIASVESVILPGVKLKGSAVSEFDQDLVHSAKVNYKPLDF